MNHQLLMTALIALLVVPSVAQATCSKEGTTTKQLGDAGRLGEEAFGAMETLRLLQQSSKARTKILPCLKEAVTKMDAAAFHRLMALEAFFNRKLDHVTTDQDRAVVEFHAALKYHPGYKLPEWLPSQHKLHDIYKRARLVSDGTPEIVYPPKKGYITVGGVRNAPRPTNTPVIVQAFDAAGVVLETHYIQPGMSLPAWGENNPFGITAANLGIDTTPAWKKTDTWWWSAGAAALIGGVFYGLAMNERSQFQDSGTSDGALSGHRDRANAFGYTSISVVTVAAILTAVGITVKFSFGGDSAPTLQTGISPTNAFMPSRFGEGGFGYGFR